MAKSTMETIIDRGGGMRFNIYPFERPYTTHQGVKVRLPRKKGDDIFVFACSAEESNGVITCKLTKLRGKRKPHSNKITPVKLKRANCVSEWIFS